MNKYTGTIPDNTKQTDPMEPILMPCIDLRFKDKIQSFELTDDGQIIAVFKRTEFDFHRIPHEMAIKRIYVAKRGKIVVNEEIKGRVIPERRVSETIEWDQS